MEKRDDNIEEEYSKKNEEYKVQNGDGNYQRNKIYRRLGNEVERPKSGAGKLRGENNGVNIKDNQIKNLKNEIKEKDKKIHEIEKKLNEEIECKENLEEENKKLKKNEKDNLNKIQKYEKQIHEHEKEKKKLERK